jgi:hydroxymethylbilane synthase
VRIRAATRGSQLAVWQAEHVAALLRGVEPGIEVELVLVDTQGDRRTDVPIHELGGKGVFAKEVQLAVLDGHADIAVHSAKDLPAITLPGLSLAAVPERGDPRDALVGSTLADLPEGAEVATGSLRRRAELWRQRPDLRMVELRGNMQTRLAKAAAHDAIVVAAVALDRLGLSDEIAERLPVDVMVPQVAQAALGVECRDDATDLRALLARIEDAPTRRCVDAERAFLAELGGDCSLPAGAHAVLDGDELTITAFLGSPDARATVRATSTGADAAVGAVLAAGLRDRLDG